MDRDLIYKHVFIQWLASRNLLDEWMENCVGHEAMSCTLGATSPYDMVMNAFDWSAVGNDCSWLSINNNWRSFLRSVEAHDHD